MKDYYKINEISKLYGIGVDSLRYYERIGILKPKRDVNGYRLYSLKDIYKLNIISDLRGLDFSMKQIREYLDHQSIDNTLALLKEEEDFIAEQLKSLKNRKQIIKERMAALTEASGTKADIYTVKALPERPCVRINEYITRDEEMDFAVKKLHRKHESKIRDFGNQAIGATVALEDINNGLINVYHNVFFILEPAAAVYDFLIPKGQYLSCHYRGEYLQSTERIRDMLNLARERKYQVLSDPFEIYIIDNRETMKQEEFLTEIQVRIF
ncbi:MerR family transcriptional regulator [Anaerocolumna xylanovorans]|uniref:DNA-binding transcriptional regulator, MerR family n=1 Tax=Anaerocolumna xylanovorans DSM 12503 TaxID=1121345 RepID=A0A1M7YG04_9FIRM|nr:MerR family transcriptional regulator [Anaerocolumna xylanovorans]SHO51499.1 DNA-binding transcriptional regulator, MerR family [Anaerocolumna xylanovorans DSM 12503]